MRPQLALVFEGQSSVKVKSLDEISSWLRKCQYVSDPVLFCQPEYWQHPITFESMRRGDCEDHALWTWRKLSDLGFYSEFMVGRGVEGDTLSNRAHACVIFEAGGKRHLLEAVAKQGSKMIFPLHEVHARFCPVYSVDSMCRTFQYEGARLIFMKKLQCFLPASSNEVLSAEANKKPKLTFRL